MLIPKRANKGDRLLRTRSIVPGSCIIRSVSTKKTIAIFTAPQGHLSIGQAIIEQLSDTYNVVQFHHKDAFFDLYAPIYQFMPMVNQIPFTLTQAEIAQPAFREMFLRRYERKFAHFLAAHRPAACISTYFMYGPALEKYQAKTSVPLFNVVTDPDTLHPWLLAPTATANLVFDEVTLRTCQKHFPDAHYEITGWFVRKRFQPAPDKKKLRQKLGLDPHLPTWIISSGSDGSTMVLKVLPTLLQNQFPLQVIVICGKNRVFYQTVKKSQAVFKRMASATQLVALPFVENINEYMQAADLVIGKAGPNTIFESAQTLTPFLAITHITGQEDGNLELIKKHRIGMVEESFFELQRTLKRVLVHPEQLDDYQAPLAKMAAYNAQAGEKLKALLEKAITT